MEIPDFETKFRVYVEWVATRTWISKVTIIGDQSINRSSSAKENTFIWLIGDTESSSPKILRKKLSRNWRIEKTLLLSRRCKNPTKVEWIFRTAGSIISNSEFITGSNSEITKQIGICERFENLPRFWFSEQFWQCPRFTSSSYPLELQKVLRRIQDAAKYTRRYEYPWKRWLSTCPTRAKRIIQWFKKYGSIIGWKWEWKTIANNAFTLVFRKSQGKSLDDGNCLLSMTHHVACIGTCTQCDTINPIIPSSEMHLGKFTDHTKVQSWIVNIRTEVFSETKNPSRALQCHSKINNK